MDPTRRARWKNADKRPLGRRIHARCRKSADGKPLDDFHSQFLHPVRGAGPSASARDAVVAVLDKVFGSEGQRDAYRRGPLDTAKNRKEVFAYIKKAKANHILTLMRRRTRLALHRLRGLVKGRKEPPPVSESTRRDGQSALAEVAQSRERLRPAGPVVLAEVAQSRERSPAQRAILNEIASSLAELTRLANEHRDSLARDVARVSDQKKRARAAKVVAVITDYLAGKLPVEIYALRGVPKSTIRRFTFEFKERDELRRAAMAIRTPLVDSLLPLAIRETGLSRRLGAIRGFAPWSKNWW